MNKQTKEGHSKVCTFDQKASGTFTFWYIEYTGLSLAEGGEWWWCKLGKRGGGRGAVQVSSECAQF